MSVVLELRRNIDGTGLAVCVCGQRSRKQVVIPLSADLSARIEVMLKVEGVGSGLALPALERH